VAPDTGSAPEDGPAAVAARDVVGRPNLDGGKASARPAAASPGASGGSAPARAAGPRPAPSLRRLRLQLTAWYVGTFALILFVLGCALFAVIAHRMASELDASLHAATRAVAQAAQIREVEAVSARGGVVDAVEELTIPGRSLYLFDSAGRPLTPPNAEEPVGAAARQAAAAGQNARHFKRGAAGTAERTLQVYAETFTLRSGTRYVAAAVADRVELEDRYASLIAAFAGAAAAALLLIAAGGWFLAGKSTTPVERTLAHMRRFMADAAHELRTPVAVLRSRAEVALQRPRDPAAYVTALSAVGAEAERLGGIVDDLLMLARADAGERPIIRRRLYLDDVALEAVDGVRVLADGRGVEVTVPEFEEAEVEADPVLLRQLIIIVLDNAIKFTPAGGRVSLRVHAHGGRATIIVDDTGVGIPAAELPHIFDRFYRGDAARPRGEGAGLGLSIARWIADVHGATIEVRSTPGAGTRVSVRFPAPPPGRDVQR
jgi:signal transduction histidine kinase